MEYAIPRMALAIVLMASVAPASAQMSGSLPLEALEARIPGLLDSAGVPGLSIAVIEDGRLAWSGAFGVRNVESGEPVGSETMFEAASLTKPLFTYALLKLVDRGAFDLDRPLSEYVSMSAFGDDPRLSRITGRMVLTHTSGISGYAEGGRLTMGTEPGTRFRYFGDAWLPLQRAVEAATGEPVHVLIEREVFGPLGMRNSSLLWHGEIEDYATPHDELGAPLVKRRFEEAHIAATLHTTAQDYARFVMAAMAGTGLSPEAARAFFTPAVSVAPGVSWGLGVGLQDDSRGRAIWQWGHWIGTRAYMIAYPDHSSGLVYLANGDGGLSIRDAVVGAVFGPNHPAAEWQNYEQYDSPARRVGLELRRLFAAGEVDAGMARMRELDGTPLGESLDEQLLNTLGYDLLRADRDEAAIAVFERNVELYPASANTYDSLGEAYLEAGRLHEALANYRRSVELDPSNGNGRAAIERIQERLRTGT